MAPSAEKLPSSVASTAAANPVSVLKAVKAEVEAPYKYDYLLPVYPDLKWAPLEEVPYTDAGLDADPNYTNLFKDASKVIELTPRFGTEIHGVSLKTLTTEQKKELARLISFRGCVFFRDQPDFEIEDQLNLGRFWGTLHKHASTSVPRDHETKNLDEVHVVYTDYHKKPNTAFPATHLWHADVTYEIQPPSYTSLKVLANPPTGGDTLWTSNYAVYDSLSEPMQKYLESLTAIHSGVAQAADSARVGQPLRRDPIETEHPVVRTHPVTGWKSVFLNPGFVTALRGIPTSESQAIMTYINSLVATQQEDTVRFKWNSQDVAFWDNRTTSHSASFGYYPYRRHGTRVTVTGEVPVFDKDGTSQQGFYDAQVGLVRNKDGSAGGNYND